MFQIPFEINIKLVDLILCHPERSGARDLKAHAVKRI
mgnify:CR=1 FL=1